MEKTFFGTLSDGRTVSKYTICNGDMSASILDFGATLQALSYQGTEVVLGYDTIKEYIENGGHLGATVGRYANRIAGGKFELEGKTVDVGCNEEGRGHLHGGLYGFGRIMWNVSEHKENAVTFCLVSPDGDMGYPGNLEMKVTFSLTEDALSIRYRGETDQTTVVNMTNHAYFNVSGIGTGDTLDTLLTIDADAITPVDKLLIPTGEMMDVTDTPFDFRSAKPIGKDLRVAHPQMEICGGYDINFAVRGEGMRRMVRAYSPKSGIVMECHSTEPGVQLYNGIFLDTEKGRGTQNGYNNYDGFCLETQHYPDSPNHPAFPSTTVTPSAPYESETIYKFAKEN